MSNQPPYQPGVGSPPPGQPPYGYPGQPPYGQPGQGYPPVPGQPYGMPPGARPANGWGIASLIISLTGCCVPAVSSSLAVLFAVLGFRAAKRTGAGRGTAVAGLILGLLGLVVQAIAGLWFAAMYQSTSPNRALAAQYVTALDQAAKSSAAGGGSATAQAARGFAFDQAEVDEFKAVGGGTVDDVWTVFTIVNGDEAMATGVVTFTAGPLKNFQMTQRREDGRWTVQSFQIVDQGRPMRQPRKPSTPSTQPAVLPQ